MSVEERQYPTPSRQKSWRVRGDTRLYWRDWHDESIVFDELSGDTHLLDMVSAIGLRHLSQEWHTVESLASSLAENLGEPMDETIQHYTNQLIDILGQKGILESIGTDS